MRLAFASPAVLGQKRRRPRVTRHATSAVLSISSTPSQPRARPSSRAVSRRALLFGITAVLSLPPVAASAVGSYDVLRPRYIPQGRPPPTGPKPEPFDPARSFRIGDSALVAEDVRDGDGEARVQRGTLVVGRWVIRLMDGTVVEESNASELFRAGTGQVYPGLDAAVLGMRARGSQRRIQGPAASFFSDITSGERALVASTDTVYAELSVLQSNPYGPN